MGRYYALHDGESPVVADADRAALLAALRRRRVAATRLSPWRLRWPTRWKRCPACSASATRPPATRIHSVCAGRRWACCAFWLRVACRCHWTRSLPQDFPHSPVLPRSRDMRVDLHNFLLERLRGYLRDQGYTANQVDAVLSMRPVRIDQVPGADARGQDLRRHCPRPSRSLRPTSASPTSSGNPAARPRPPSIDRCSTTAPSTTCIPRWRNCCRWYTPTCVVATTPRHCVRWRQHAVRSTAFSTMCW